MVARLRPAPTSLRGDALLKCEGEADDPVARGRAAWQRRKVDAKASWNDWKLIGEALLVGRQAAMKQANKDEPRGRKYVEIFHWWIESNGFGDIDRSDRAKLLQIMENLRDVEGWLETLPEGRRVTLNHPCSIWRAFICPNRGNRGNPRSEQSDDNDSGETDAPATDDEKAEETNWQRGLLLRAQKSRGDANMEMWAMPEPPDPGLIAAVRKAAEAWTDLAVYLDSIRDASSEKLAEARERYAQGQHSASEAKARAAERGERQRARWRTEASNAWAN